MNTFTFKPENYGDWCSESLSSELIPSLGPGSPDRLMGDRLEALTIETLFRDASVMDRQMASCCLAGLWLWFDYLNESHQISQRISNTEGSYWHGIMHRREPDYPNAKYWFDKVGEHAIFDELAVATTELLCQSDVFQVSDVLDSGAGWDACRFVDLCQRHEGTSSPAEAMCRKIARAEQQMLFDHCYRQATTGK